MNSIPQAEGRLNEAITNYSEALKRNPDSRAARRNLAILLVRVGRSSESIPLFYEELLRDPESVKWLTGLTTEAMQLRDLTLAGEFANILAGLRLASTLHPKRVNGELPHDPVHAPEVFLTISKLQHDIEQFLYLQDKGILNDDFSPVIKNYQQTIHRLQDRRSSERVPLDDEAQKTIGHVFNRILHIHHAPRVKKALSDKWNGAAVEHYYLHHAPGVVIVDDFLCPEALESMRRFCLESTVWTGNRYTHGRLGAFFHDGFNCPLLLQIAEELRNTLPSIIGNRYPLRQLWGFKNGHYVPADSSLHADFAAVNVNFWVTPEDANLDPGSGGLIVYGVDAP